MTISEMHVWFRQYAQQMGMQNVRAILPEQIDLVINTSISDIVNKTVQENINLTNDRIITDNSKIGQINALRTLYDTDTIPFGSATTGNPIIIPNENYNSKGLCECHEFDMFMENSKVLHIVDMSVSYINKDNEILGLFPVRIIDDVYLADVLNDFVLKPRVRTPISVFHNGTFDIYFGVPFEGEGSDYGLVVAPGLKVLPNQLRLSYIRKPAKVAYLEDVQGQNVDCDLPESMHVDILKHAVDLYNITIRGNLYSAQQQNENQNRENVRNNAIVPQQQVQ